MPYETVVIHKLCKGSLEQQKWYTVFIMVITMLVGREISLKIKV